MLKVKAEDSHCELSAQHKGFQATTEDQLDETEPDARMLSCMGSLCCALPRAVHVHVRLLPSPSCWKYPYLQFYCGLIA